MNTVNLIHQNITNWWPVTDEEWERLNFPEKFNNPVDKKQ